LEPEYIAPLVRNGAAGIITDNVLWALSDGFETNSFQDGGWSRDSEYAFCYELGREVRNNHAVKASLNAIQKRARKRLKND
jgi:hypothetical protein